jgi:hypothetical protein
MVDEKSPYVLVSVFKEDAKEQDVIQAASKIATIIDEWNMQGNMIWSGSFDDDKTAMSVIEGTKPEIDAFFRKYDDVCKSFLSSYMYQWDAMPLLSIIGHKQAAATLEVAPQ